MDELLAGIYEALLPRHKVRWEPRYDENHRPIGGCLLIKIEYTDVWIYIDDTIVTIVHEIPEDDYFSKLEFYRVNIDIADPKSIDRIQQVVDECYKYTKSLKDIVQGGSMPVHPP